MEIVNFYPLTLWVFALLKRSVKNVKLPLQFTNIFVEVTLATWKLECNIYFLVMGVGGGETGE